MVLLNTENVDILRELSRDILDASFIGWSLYMSDEALISLFSFVELSFVLLNSLLGIKFVSGDFISISHICLIISSVKLSANLFGSSIIFDLINCCNSFGSSLK